MRQRLAPAERGSIPARDHYAEVTNQVIAALETGTAPWRRPWDAERAGGPSMPCNAITGVRYRGINVVILAMSPLSFASGDPRWATYKQAAEHGWQVRKGERGTTAYFFKRVEVRDDTTDSDNEEAMRRVPLLRAFTLFNASQIDGVPPFVPLTAGEAPWRAPEAAETIITNSGADVRIGGDRAFYSPNTDHIQMPPKFAFATSEGWCSTILHEASHWSGGESRLNRDLRGKFGSHGYAMEEVRAELAQCMICSEIGITCDFSNDAAYIDSWLACLRGDRKEIFRAAADAQRIADYLLAFHPAYAGRLAESSATPVDADTATNNDAALAEAA